MPSLSLPDIKHLPIVEQLSIYEAVRLFLDRATLVAPHFGLDHDNAPFIAQICYRLDGIPLAIELPAARVKMFSVEQTSKRLDDRFRLLTGGGRTSLPRQQPLRALVDWSYDILSYHERLLLCRLSVFMGGWTLEAAEEVCSGDGIDSYDVLDLLTQLVNCYLTTAQNLRLLGASEEILEEIKAALTGLGLTVKVPGSFPKPKVCVGVPFCKLGLVDTFALSDRIWTRYGDRTGVKPKYKIAISGCPACCAGSLLLDIGIVATRNGFEVYADGKGGPLPKVGKRIARGLTEEEVVDLVGELADYHASKTESKQRMAKLIDAPDFPRGPDTL